MDWHAEGRRWADRWFTGNQAAWAVHGNVSQTHLRALLRLTNTSADHHAAQRGWRERIGEISRMTMEEIDAILYRERA